MVSRSRLQVFSAQEKAALGDDAVAYRLSSFSFFDVLCVSVVPLFSAIIHHGDTENTEVAQRVTSRTLPSRLSQITQQRKVAKAEQPEFRSSLQISRHWSEMNRSSG